MGGSGFAKAFGIGHSAFQTPGQYITWGGDSNSLSSGSSQSSSVTRSSQSSSKLASKSDFSFGADRLTYGAVPFATYTVPIYEATIPMGLRDDGRVDNWWTNKRQSGDSYRALSKVNN